MTGGNVIGSRALPPWAYHRPGSLEEALELLGELGATGRILAGGTDLLPGIRSGRFRLAAGTHVVDISRLRELDFIERDGAWLRIGARTSLSAIAEFSLVRESAPMLAEAVGQMASLQVRNQGTVGGNLANASPAADTAPPLLAQEARLVLMTSGGRRSVDLADFFVGPGRTVLGPGELIAEVQVPLPREDDLWCFQKLGRRNAFTLSVVSVAVLLRVAGGALAQARIAIGAAAPRPMRALQAEGFLTGQPISAEAFDRASSIAAREISPISDVRASAAYRQDMCRVLTRRAFASCWNRGSSEPL